MKIIELLGTKVDDPDPLSAIADTQEISRKYLELLVSSLRKSGMVGSRKGVRGGYYLTREPSEISLWEIFCALEGRSPLVECVPHPETCVRADDCTTRTIWVLLDQKLQDFWESFTLQDLIDRLPEFQSGAVDPALVDRALPLA